MKSVTERICERCQKPLSWHSEGDEGYVKVGLKHDCLGFTDPIHREAARLLTKAAGQRSTPGWVH